MYIDIHTHSHWPDNDIRSLFNIRYGVDVTTTISSPFSIGIHPWDADSVHIDKTFLDMAHKASAIGECGLDKRCNIKPELQEIIFIKQIELSRTINKPLIVHCVGKYGRLLELSKLYSPHPLWIIHGCYTSTEWIKSALSQNMIFSVGIREIKRLKGAEMINAIPLKRLIFESDELSLSVKHIYDYLSISPADIPHVNNIF